MKLLTIEILALFILFGCVRADIDEPGALPENRTRSISADTTLSSAYYWFDGRKIPLVPTDKYFKLLKAPRSNSALSANDGTLFKHPYSTQIDSTGVVYTTNLDGVSAKSKFGAEMQEIYSIPFFKDDKGNEIRISNLFYVILKDASDEAYLRKLAQECNVILLGKDEVISLWYTLACTSQSRGNALEMANLFEETGKFKAVGPHFMGGWSVASNDLYYNQQWNLNNTGQRVAAGKPWTEVYDATPGIDIGYKKLEPYLPDASEIIVAVIDVGVDRNHPELNTYKCYDGMKNIMPGYIYGKYSHEESHGTSCAGVIGAISDNQIGIAGIAPNVKIMGIAVDIDPLSPTPMREVEEGVARGVQYAMNHGASVISNSWGGYVKMNLVVSICSDALTKGRNGKGCIIVCSSGNYNENNPNYFPGGTNPDFLCVGAVNPNGKRAVEYAGNGDVWGSNYGSVIDVVAPGTGVPATVNMPEAYTTEFGGTSAACPQVAAVAALMLAYNPDLTQQEVCDIIKSTATKLDSYGYTRTDEHPHGLWNEEVGYGMLNAYDAVMATIPPEEIHDKTFSQSIEYIRQSLTFKNINVRNRAELSARSVTDFVKFKSLTVADNATVTAQSKKNSTYEVVRLTGSSSIDSSSERSAEWENVQIAGSSRINSVSKLITTLENMELSGRGKLTASAAGIRVNGPFRVEKGAELRLQAGGK